jgi:hypothetical protein
MGAEVVTPSLRKLEWINLIREQEPKPVNILR